MLYSRQKQTVYFISICLIVSITIVFLLYLFSNKPSYNQNSFKRIFPPLLLVYPKELDIKFNSYYFSGVTSNYIYLGNTTAPQYLLVVDNSLKKTEFAMLAIKDSTKIEFKSIKVIVDSPFFYIMDGSIPAIFRGTLKNWIASHYKYDSAKFNVSFPISSSSFALRALNVTNDFILGKETNTFPYVSFFPNLLEKQIDGVFSTDGMFNFDPGRSLLVYVYYYRNQFVCMDTSFNLLYRGNTIDTVNKAQIKLSKIASENSVTMSAPPLIVNKYSCVSRNYLFINSNLIGKDESKDIFNKSSVIDVYNLNSGSYKLSFYLPDHNNNKMRSFRVFNSKIIILYDHYIIAYDLDSKYFIN